MASGKTKLWNVMELLDISIIEEVRDALGDAAYRGFAQRMLEEVRMLVPVMAEQLQAGALAALATAAHRAAGSAVSVGARGLHGALITIEDSARSGQATTALPALLAALSGQIAETEAAIAEVLDAA